MAATKVCVSHPKLAHFKPLLRKWTQITAEFATRTEDLPYWYDERPDTSILAGAVWRLKGVAIEEMPAKKERPGKAPGRIDLYFMLGDKGHIVEAKRRWIWPSLLEVRGRVSGALDSACEQALRYDYEADLRLGVVFVVPYVDASEAYNASERIDYVIRSVSEIDSDFIAWTFPALSTDLMIDEGDYHPGVLLVGRMAR